MSTLDQASGTKISRLIKALAPLQANLSLPQLLALCHIRLEPGLSVNELAERLNCPQQTASRYAAALLGRYQGIPGTPAEISERSKLDPLVVQEISQTDPRKRALFLSAHGEKLLNNVVKYLGT
jgi:DNA-binding MarR family transcriptional regulator